MARSVAMQKTLSKTLLATLMVFIMVSAALPSTGGALETPAGHWDHLGEDGAIWVPAERPAVTYLPTADLGDYHNYTEMVDLLEGLASDRPGVFTLHDVGTSVDGRTIWMLQVMAPGEASGRPRVLLDGAHHGNEVIGSESLIRFLKEIDNDYDTNSSMRAILGNVTIDVVPMLNVDSNMRIPQCSHYAMCRKNSNGVDLNRNYADHWGGGGSSSNPGSATYRGPAPLSEPETQAVAALLDDNDYALHASFHSGTELILWPYGWTTAAPPEAPLYQTLGDELTAVTGVPHGQTSRVLYTASGTTMDQAYGSADGWRAVSVSPEVYGGSGGAFDWWYFFNPPEDEASIRPITDRWSPFIWHLAAEAPQYRPALLGAPTLLEIGPDAGHLSASVESATKRPLMDAELHLHLDGAPVRVVGDNPVTLPDGSGPKDIAFAMLVERGGLHDVRLRLDAGPAGHLERTVALSLVQVGLGLQLAREVMGSPHTNTATATVDVGPFDAVAGDLSFRLQPSGKLLGNRSFDAVAGTPAVLSIDFEALGLDQGEHEVVATATFTASDANGTRSGVARVAAPFSIVRPQIELDKRMLTSGPVLEPVPVLALLRNTGALAAEDLVVTETLPPGYLYWFRDGPVPIPIDPLGAPRPDEVTVQPDGSTQVTWRLGDVAPDGLRALRYRVLPLVPGEVSLSSTWHYEGDFGDVQVAYTDAAEVTYEAT